MMTVLTALAVFLVLAGLANAGEAVLACTADTSINAFSGDGNEPNEWKICSGDRSQIKIKHRENMLLLRFDLTSVPANAKIASAMLRLHVEGGSGYALNHVCVSTVPTEWDEKTANFLEAGPGKPWGPSKLHFCAVAFGTFGTLESVNRAKSVGDGWWEIPVAPRVAHAMRDSFGSLAVADETGIFQGKFANIFISSRESKFAPQLRVHWEGEDHVAPSPVRDARVLAGPDPGSVFLEFTCGGNDGEAGTALGYEIRYQKGAPPTPDSWTQATLLPRVLTKRPEAPGRMVRTFIDGLEPGETYAFGIITYDECGNRSPLASSTVGKARETTKDVLPLGASVMQEKGGPVSCGALSIWATDQLHQIDPVKGRVLVGFSYVDADLRAGNAVYDGKRKTVVLTALKGEQLNFQMVFEAATPVNGIRLTPTEFASGTEKIPTANVEFGRVWYLKAKDAWYPNAVPAMKPDEALCLPTQDNAIEGQTLQSVSVGIFVPYDTQPGAYKGVIAVESSAGMGELPVELRVMAATMPKRLNFEIELNAYSDRQPLQKFHELHRLAHLHRTGYNTLPYSHNGKPTVAYVPPVEGFGKDAKVTDWTAFDAYMGPLLDGSAFKDLPRAGEPLRFSYLPFYENYPMPLYKGYAQAALIEGRPAPNDKANYDKWRDKVGREEDLIEGSFNQGWLDGNRAVVAQFVKHFEERGWLRTKYQVMCNNVPFKGTLTSWTLDEPQWGRDFRALAFFYKALVHPARAASNKIEIVPRNGVSRPQWQGDRLDEVSDFNDVGSGAMSQYYPLIRRRMLERGDTYWTYGGGINVNKDLAMLQAAVLRAWCRGQIGILPSWTAFDGGTKGWDEDHNLAIALPAAHGYPSWTATLKLKALRRAQQDAELLNLLAARPGWDRWRVARAVVGAVNFSAKNLSDRPEDAASEDFGEVRQEDFTRIRHSVIELLNQTP